VEAPEIARYLQAHTGEADRIGVRGSEPEIYFLANRKSATGYIYTCGLMERQPYSQRMQEEMIAELTAAHSKYLVYVRVPTSWLARSSDEKILKWNKAYLNQCYDLVGVVDIPPGRPSKYAWDADVNGYNPQSQNLLVTYKAKTDSPCAVESPS